MAQAQKSIIGAWKALNESVLSVHQQRCAKVRNRNVQCLKCADACTSGCISLVDGELVIDASKCVGCGTCATVCPTCALEPLNPNDAELMSECLNAARAGDGTTAYVACSRVVAACEGLLDDERVVHVVCLGRIEESLTCGLAAAGVEHIVLVCGMCDMCAQKYGRVTAESVITSSNDLLSAWNSPARVTLVHDVPGGALAAGVDEAQAAEAYAAYFAHECACEPIPAAQVETLGYADEADSFSGGQAGTDQRLTANGLSHVMKDGTLPHFIPNRRERLLDSLASMGTPQEKVLSSRLWGCVVIDGSKCTSCRMCATFCPTGAIRKFDNEDGTFGVTHHPADCVKCRSCHDICREGAIIIQDQTRTNYLMDGAVHTYTMRPRDVELDQAHQILDTIRLKIPGNVYER